VTVPDAAADRIRTVCSYCGVGCGLVMDVVRDPATGRRRVARVSGDRQHPANAGRLCTKGATTAEMLAAPGRLAHALVRERREAAPEPADVDAAVTRVAEGLLDVVRRHGPDAVAFYVSGQLSLEAQYLANKLAKGFVRTRYIESNSRLCMASAGSGYKLSLGADGPPGSYRDFDHADLFLVIGANMADCHPVLFLRMMERVAAGARLIVVDPRRTATADRADLHLPVRPGTDLALLNGILHLLVEEGRIDAEFIAEFTDGWERMPPFLAEYTPAAVAAVTGLPEESLRQAARWISEAGAWMSCWTMGLNQSTHGTWNTNALVNLHLATGAVCRPGCGPFSLTGQPNAMGGREMGYMGPGLPGQRSVAVAHEREFTERLWNVPSGTLRTEAGQGTVDMFRRMAEGGIRACWIICTNPVASVANRANVVAGLRAAELVVTQDAFAETETNAYADVVLPAALWAEGEGVMVNSERNLTLARAALDPPGQALPDWELIARVARAMGFADAFAYTCAEEVFEELKQAWNPATGWDLRGVTYERLRTTPVQWPAPPGREDDRSPVRYLNDGVSQDLLVAPDGSRPRLAFPTATGRAAFYPRPYLSSGELPDDDYPFALNTGRVQHQWHTLTKTGKVARLNKLDPGPFVEVNPADADRLAVVDGELAEMVSRRGRAVLPVRVSDRVQPGCLFAPFHWNDLFGEDITVNAVTDDAVDPISFQPGFKMCAVALRPLPREEPAGDTGACGGGALDVLAAALGVGGAQPPAFDAAERRYLAGFLAGLRAAPPTAVPVLPAGAPLDPGHALWVDGLLAGLFSTVSTSPTAAAVEGAAPGGDGPSTVHVLWASQTGRAEEVAAEVAARLTESGHRTALVAMEDTHPGRLAPGTPVLFVTSTFGDGDAPDNGAAFWKALDSPDQPALDGLSYAVLALGDSGYANFCGHGKRLDDRLRSLGARPLAARADCEPDEVEAVETWLRSVTDALAEQAPPTGRAAPAERAEPTERPASPDGTGDAGGATRAVGGPHVRTPRGYGKASPLDVPLVGNALLSGAGSGKEVRRFTFDTGGEGGPALAYRPGDALGVWPANSPALVEEWLAATGLDPDTPVDLPRTGTLPWAEALRTRLDATRITPALLEFVARRTGDRELRRLLRPGAEDALARFCWDRQAVDVLGSYPVRASAQEWCGVLRGLRPRLYSISSSPLAHPGRVSVTVSVLRWTNTAGRARGGVCSTWLADAPQGTRTPVFVRRSAAFHPPADPAVPMVMVGPGTGVAPFIGFLEERRALGHTAPNWLFFGEQHAATDFYYRRELEEFAAGGHLDRLDLAFSRDQRAKVYVQDRMRENGPRLFRWLEEGAHLYVCGDAARMAKDVDRVLHEVVARQGALSEEAAAEYVQRLIADRRYLRDVY